MKLKEQNIEQIFFKFESMAASILLQTVWLNQCLDRLSIIFKQYPQNKFVSDNLTRLGTALEQLDMARCTIDTILGDGWSNYHDIEGYKNETNSI